MAFAHPPAPSAPRRRAAHAAAPLRFAPPGATLFDAADHRKFELDNLFLICRISAILLRGQFDVSAFSRETKGCDKAKGFAGPAIVKL